MLVHSRIVRSPSEPSLRRQPVAYALGSQLSADLAVVQRDVAEQAAQAAALAASGLKDSRCRNGGCARWVAYVGSSLLAASSLSPQRRKLRSPIRGWRKLPRGTRARLLAKASDQKIRRAEQAEDAELPPCVCRDTLNGVEVWVVGTAHISAKSAGDVDSLITRIQPDSVIVELSVDRVIGLFASTSTDPSVVVDVDQSVAGFTRARNWSELAALAPAESEAMSEHCAATGQLLLRGPAVGQLRLVPLRPSVQDVDDEKWMADAIARHRYSSNYLQLQPALSFMFSVARFLLPRAVSAFYLSIGTAKQSGSEFVAATRGAAQCGCPLVLGDVEADRLFDVEAALKAARRESFAALLAGPLVRPCGGQNCGVDFFAAMRHLFGGTEELQAISRAVPLVWVALHAIHDPIYETWPPSADSGAFDLLPSTMEETLALAALVLWSSVFLAGGVFLLTAARDESLFMAVSEATAEVAAARSGSPGGRVVLVCGLAHVNGVARRLERASLEQGSLV